MRLLRELLEAELKQIELLDLPDGADSEVIGAAVDHHRADVTFDGERVTSWMSYTLGRYARDQIEKGSQFAELKGHGFHPYKAVYTISVAFYSPSAKACFFELDMRYIMQDKGHNNSAAYGSFKLKATSKEGVSEVKSIKRSPDDVDFKEIWNPMFFSGEHQLQ